MPSWIRLAGENRAIELFGIRMVGMNAENGGKLLLSVVLVIVVYAINMALRGIAHVFTPGKGINERYRFWIRQGIQVVTAATLTLGLVSIWFDDPTRLTTAAGMLTAGLAFALQRVVTALAGYVVILRGKTFSVGDRIVMGGVRGDVIALRFTQTVIMEMGQPPGEQADAPSMWVRGRQYTGRIVSVTNAKIFDEAIYNYTREFPFVWDEMSIPISFTDDAVAAERILLEAAQRHSLDAQTLAEPALAAMERQYAMRREDARPNVFWRITDNWLELSVRFLVSDHGTRAVKDKMSREILANLNEAGIAIASATVQLVGTSKLEIVKK